MKQHTTHAARAIAATLIVIAGAAAANAQSGSTSREDQSITVTGCLQPAGSDRTPVGTSGSAAGSSAAATRTDSSRTNDSDGGSFMLVNARVGAAPGGGSAVTTVAPAGSGTTESAVRAGSAPPSPTLSGGTDRNGNASPGGAMYALRGDNPELTRHVGQEVEISGRLAASANSAPSTAGASATSGNSTATGSTPSTSADRVPQLEVRTLRMIASVCAAR